MRGVEGGVGWGGGVKFRKMVKKIRKKIAPEFQRRIKGWRVEFLTFDLLAFYGEK